jgi:hypothetical protein
MGWGAFLVRSRSGATLAVLALSLAFVGCSSFDKVGSGDHVYDEVNSLDLSARFPAPAGRPNAGAPPPRSEIYRGAGGDFVNAAAQNGVQVAESSEGFDLNFQKRDHVGFRNRTR